MKKYVFLILLLVGSIQIEANTANSTQNNHLKKSITELDAAFIVAVKKNRLDQVEELLQAGANVATPIPYTWTSGDCDWNIETSALVFAIRKDRLKLVEILAKFDKNLNKAVEIAIFRENSDIVKVLIEEGADVNYVKKNHGSFLISAVESTDSESQRRRIVKILLQNGANVRYVNKYGRTALMEAVIKHDLLCTKDILEALEKNKGSFFSYVFGTNPINYADSDGNTALILAIQHVKMSYYDSEGKNDCINSQKIIEVLLDVPGIDPDLVNKKGETARSLFEKLRAQRAC
ncbi:MAG: ankyrin repeat domain-containing protein [Rhabdochlamydiaceae bacterium]|nr:ankyrin repeat domain-containing protein [Candidatus Amphrikana amoebophyrae]